MHYVYGIDAEHVSNVLGPSTRSIWNWVKKFEKYGTVEDGGRRTRQSRWPNEVLEFVKHFVEHDPTFLIEELLQSLSDNFPELQNISSSTICRALRHDLNLTRKVICKRATEASRTEVAAYKCRLSPFYTSPHQLVFVDETSKNSKHFLRKFGWSVRGQKCHSSVPFARGKRVSVLAAMDVKGFFTFETTEGTFDRAAFHTALVEKILPLMNPYPLPRSILVLDNARIHVYEQIYKTVEAFGVMLVFLPPYCPQLNPIEIGFGLLKRWIEKHAAFAWNLDPVLVLRKALRNCILHCECTFVHCGYGRGYLDFSKVLEDSDDF